MTSFAYDILRELVAIQPTKVQRKWNKHLPSPVEDWSTYYRIPFLCTSTSKLTSFQYRIFHRTIGTNLLLKKMGIKDHEDCFFCDSNPETIEHLFWYCDRIFPLWSALANCIWLVTEIEMEFPLSLFSWAIQTLCLVKMRLIVLYPDFAGVQSYLHFYYNIEKFACDFSNQDKILSKWKPMKKLFC